MIAKTREGKGGRLLQIDNVHASACGPPPSVDATGNYLGYFENCYGEQWVFIGDRKTGKAIVRGGDCGWEREYKLSLKRPCPDTILNEPEKMWIITCFMAMSDKSFDEVATNYNKTGKQIFDAAWKQIKDERQRR
jgi:hypothetical protein